MGGGSSAKQAHIGLERAKNKQVSVNRLPRELLSNIFVIGEVTQNATRLKLNQKPCRFPLLISQVCSYWREIAINSPFLWTYIHVDRPPPSPVAALYLNRAGPQIPLHIELELRTGYWEHLGIGRRNWGTQVNHVPGLLEFLASNGAYIPRWKSLIIHVKTPRVAFEIIHVLNTESAPALQFFSCTWMAGLANQYIDEEEYCLEDLTSRHGSFGSLRLSGPSFPKMRSVELSKIPLRFVLDRLTSPPLFSGLVSLRLAAGFDILWFKDLHHLFFANPRLEELYISSGLGSTHRGLDIYSKHIPLPLLRRLELCTHGVSQWVCPVLQTIDTPNLEHFALSMSNELPQGFDVTNIFVQIATGRRPIETTEGPLVPNPIFPSLRSLDLNFTWAHGSREAFRILLSALSPVQRLTIPSGFIHLLDEEPWLLPNLSRLKLLDTVPFNVGYVLQRRLDAGLSVVREIEVSPCSVSEIMSGLPDSVRVVEGSPPGSEMELYASDDDPNDVWDD